MRRDLNLLMAVLVSGSLTALHAEAGPAGSEAKSAEHALFTPTAIQWKDGPASLPPGAKWAVLVGDPSKEGMVTFRLWLPEGWKVPPHWHPAVEHITVISGTFHLGRGDQFEKEKGSAMPAGSFAFMAPRMNHFGWVETETILQIHAAGPWQINYVNPADDPRLMKQ